MDRIIAKLHKKPEHHRRHITFALSASITAIIFMVWVTVVAPNTIKNATLAQNEQITTSAETPIATVKNSVAATFEGIKNIFQKGNDSLKEVNFSDEYGKVKTQVKQGDIKLIPKTE